jgi:acetate kinase
VRGLAAGGLGFLGVELDASRNDADRPADRELSASGSRARTLVIEAREDLEIARQVRAVLGGRRPA